VPLLLNPEQIAGLRALQRERDLALLGEQLALAFPEAPARLGERYPTLIALAAQRGAVQGLTHLVALARYLACWVTLGAEFEGKPGFEWAASLLAAKGRDEGSRVFATGSSPSPRRRAHRPPPSTPPSTSSIRCCTTPVTSAIWRTWPSRRAAAPAGT
jgi:hypothetical protein